jgi:tetratricopeptide (TPR) repeat protein
LYLAAEKPPGTVRIFVFGESAAMGDPEPAYGFARQLERLLQARHPAQKVEVINAAMTAINSHVIREIARDCAPLQGDFWLVFAGNNEVIGPFGAGTVFGSQTPGLAVVRLVMAMKRTRLGQALTQLTRGQPASWQGLEFFLKWRVTRDSPRLKQVYGSFSANLGEIAARGRESGATLVLSTVPVNLRDFPPLASLHRTDLPPEKLAEWQKCFTNGAQAQAAGKPGEAMAEFRRAAEIDDTFAELAFQRAHCELALGQAAAAQTDYRLARDLDTLRFRADSRLNEIIRQTAKEKGVALIDADEALGRGAEKELFYDHVHLNFTGNYRLAVLFAEELEKHWPGTRTDDSPWLSEDDLVRRLAYTGFDEKRVGTEMRARMQQPPFNAQSNFRVRDEGWRAVLSGLSAPPASCLSNYQAAVALCADDWVLHANFGRVLEAAGSNSGAAAEWSAVSRLMPHSPEGWANQGRFARLKGETSRAQELLQTALNQQPDSVEARTEMGILEAGLGRADSAQRQYRRVLELQPGFSAARVNLGLLLAQRGDPAGAAAEYREALRWHTNNIEARINLANLLGGQGKTSEALALYEQAVALEPANPAARYNLGRLLMAENRPADAVTHLQVALQQRPSFAEVHFEIAQAMARLGRDTPALSEFAQAVRLKPDWADAHLNYGVALARSGRYAEAEREFREALRLRPQDERAQQMLGQAARMARGSGRSK